MASYNLNLLITPCVKEITVMDMIIHGPEGINSGDFHFEVKDFSEFVVQLLYTYSKTDSPEEVLYTRVYEKSSKTFKKWGVKYSQEISFLKVLGNTEIGKDLIVGGTGTFGGDLSTNGNLKVGKELSVGSNIHCGNKIDAVTINANQISSEANITTSQVITKTLDASEAITTKNFTTENITSTAAAKLKTIQGESLSLTKDLEVGGNTSIGRSLSITENLSIGQNFSVAGSSTLDSIEAKSLKIEGHTILNTLEVTGDFEFENAKVYNLTVKNSAIFNGPILFEDSVSVAKVLNAKTVSSENITSENISSKAIDINGIRVATETDLTSLQTSLIEGTLKVKNSETLDNIDSTGFVQTADVSQEIDGQKVFLKPVFIRGSEADKPLHVRNIIGDDGSGTIDDLYLQYGANKPISLGNTGTYNISADGSYYNGRALKANHIVDTGNDTEWQFTQTVGENTTKVLGWYDAGGGASKIQPTQSITLSYVKGAVWNDLTDLVVVPDDTKLEYGKCYCTNGSEYIQSTKYCQSNIIGIHSDTAGFSMGHIEGKTQLHIGVAGFVLAFTDKKYPSGTPLTCTKNGYLTKMKVLDRLFHPERLVGTYWKDELEKDWNGIKVNNRNWIKIS